MVVYQTGEPKASEILKDQNNEQQKIAQYRMAALLQGTTGAEYEKILSQVEKHGIQFIFDNPEKLGLTKDQEKRLKEVIEIINMTRGVT